MGQAHGVGQTQPPDRPAGHGADKIVEKTGIGPRVILRADGDEREARGGLDGQMAQLAQHPGTVLVPDAEVQVRDGKGKVHAEHPLAAAAARSSESARHQASTRPTPTAPTMARRSAMASGPATGMPASISGTPAATSARAMASLSVRAKTTPGGLFAVAQGGVDQMGTEHGRRRSVD